MRGQGKPDTHCYRVYCTRRGMAVGSPAHTPEAAARLYLTPRNKTWEQAEAEGKVVRCYECAPAGDMVLIDGEWVFSDGMADLFAEFAEAVEA